MPKIVTDPALVDELLTRGVEEIIEKDHLKKALTSNRKLRVKFGIDPTSPDIHLGHSVPLLKLRAFQGAGHKAVLIIGDFTAMIGDPSGRSEERKPLTKQDVKTNMRYYLAQAGKIINIKKTEVRYNSAWYGKKGGLEKILEVTRAATIQQVLKRRDFAERMEKGNDVSVLESLYPILQGYDSVAVRADVELGGGDQMFNLLMGRKVQRHFGMPEQDIITFPLLEGTDGSRKMSKSAGNYIGLQDTPDEMYGKLMSIPDMLIEKYFLLCTTLQRNEMADIIASHTNPRDQKARLAYEVVKLYHGEKNARAAQIQFEKLFSKNDAPDELPEIAVSQPATTALVVDASGIVKSKSERRRLIEQGGVYVNGARVTNPDESRKNGEVIKIGKKHFFRIRIQ